MWSALFLSAYAAFPVSSDRPAGPGLAVTVQLFCGSLLVSAAEVDTVQIRGTIDDPEALAVSSSPGHVSVVVESRLRNKDCADLVIRAPPATSVGADTMSASVTVEGLTGALDLETVSGAIRVGGTPASVTAESISGAVRIAGGVGSVDVSTMSGPIAVDGVRGPIEVETISGNVAVTAGADPVPLVQVETVSGAIQVLARLSPDARVALATHSGAVALAVPAGPMQLETSTFSGPIRSAFGKMCSAECRQTIGVGGPRIALQSFSGPITVTELP